MSDEHSLSARVSASHIAGILPLREATPPITSFSLPERRSFAHKSASIASHSRRSKVDWKIVSHRPENRELQASASLLMRPLNFFPSSANKSTTWSASQNSLPSYFRRNTFFPRAAISGALFTRKAPSCSQYFIFQVLASSLGLRSPDAPGGAECN